MVEYFTTVVAVVGRPNAGKSTLINSLVGQKVTITSRRPQTTRYRIHAIHTSDNYQFVFIDTPGINRGSRTVFLKELNKVTRSALSDADLVIFMLDGLSWSRTEDVILRYLPAAGIPCIVIVNKIDRYVQDRSRALAFMQKIEPYYAFAEIVPLSSYKPNDIVYLEKLLRKYAVPGRFIFPEEQLTDQNMQFYVSELIREKILRRFNQEVPYSAAVVIDQYEEFSDELHIKATIHVEKESHRQIIVGTRGIGIREIGKQTRQVLEKETGNHVDIRLWVKVNQSWSMDPELLRKFGYALS